MDKLIIAIDGYSACGKSTLAKDLARILSLSYIDTGAMYRAVTLYVLENGIDIGREDEVENALNNIEIHFDLVNGANHCFLNGEDVEAKIRTQKVSGYVSEVSTVSIIRRAMVSLQRKMSKRNVILDGRDIGTVVFPNANFKFFITASNEVRARRRLLEFKEKGSEVSLDQIRENLEKRDRIDSTRSDSPLKIAEDAIVIDNSFLNKDEQLQLLIKIIDVSKHNKKEIN